MTFCGFDPEMSVGLAKFGEGVAASTVRKALDAGRSAGEHVDLELGQLRELILELEHVESAARETETRVRARALRGLALVCEACFETARGVNTADALRQHIGEQFALYGELVQKLEDAYEGCPPGASVKERTQAGIQASTGMNQSEALTGKG